MDELAQITDWRHPYVIDGKPVPLAKPWYAEWHPWRWSVDRPVIEQALGGSLSGRTLLDTACNDGWYGFQAAAAGARVTGIDARAEAVARGRLIAERNEVANIDFLVGNLENRDVLSGTFDASLFYGILYHLADPIGVIARMGEVTDRIMCLQTFIHALDPSPTLHLLRESPDLPGNAMTELITTPTQRAIVMMLHNAGFDHVYRAMPVPYRAKPTGSRAYWQWAFFYGVKGAPLETSRTLRRIGEFDAPLNSFGPVSRIVGQAERVARRMAKKDIRGLY